MIRSRAGGAFASAPTASGGSLLRIALIVSAGEP